MLRYGAVYACLSIALMACAERDASQTQRDSSTVTTSTNVEPQPTLDSSRSASRTAPDTSQASRGLRLLPVDAAAEDPSFLEFRTSLLQAVRAKNSAALMAVVDSSIRLSYGGASGHADFHKKWKPIDPESRVWSELEWILTHGGDFRRTNGVTQFWSPYVYSNWPEGPGAPDPFEHAAITGKDIELRASPTGEVRQRLSYDIVKDIDGSAHKESKPQWVRVKTMGGVEGYVPGTRVRSQLDYRSGFERRHGAWRMVIFIAGD